MTATLKPRSRARAQLDRTKVDAIRPWIGGTPLEPARHQWPQHPRTNLHLLNNRLGGQGSLFGCHRAVSGAVVGKHTSAFSKCIDLNPRECQGGTPHKQQPDVLAATLALSLRFTDPFGNPYPSPNPYPKAIRDYCTTWNRVRSAAAMQGFSPASTDTT